MKKFVLSLSLFFVLCLNAQAEVYHGIDIDAIYKSSDWNNKEEIKELIDDYTLLLQYQKELDNCQIESPYILSCYDNVAEKIINNLYIQSEYNIKDYKNLKNALSEAYGLKNCRNKYNWPVGSICEIDTLSDMKNILKMYIQDLLDFSKEKMFAYSSVLEKYE